MMKRLQAFALMALFVGAVGAVLYLWWSLDLRWRPRVIARNQAEIAGILQGAGWVSPGLAGPRLYLVVYRDCAACGRFAATELPALQKAGVDTRVIVFARPDLNGQARSTPAERATVAELWVNRSWALFQRWSAAPSNGWTAPGVAPADGDVARTSVVQAGRDQVDRLAPLLKASGVRMDYPVLVWWGRDGRMEGCACTRPQQWRQVRADLGVG
jgi:hypothetical protein